MKSGRIFVLDAETDGIYGSVLSIAAIAAENFKETAHFYGAVTIEKDEIKEQWVKDNVFDCLKNAETFYGSEAELLDAFWEFYEERVKDSAVIADVPYPVEDGIFRKCIERDRDNRLKLSPFPLYDLESMLVSHGYDRLTDRIKLAGVDIPQHDAINDVKITIKVLEMLYGQK